MKDRNCGLARRCSARLGTHLILFHSRSFSSETNSIEIECSLIRFNPDSFSFSWAPSVFSCVYVCVCVRACVWRGVYVCAGDAQSDIPSHHSLFSIDRVRAALFSVIIDDDVQSQHLHAGFLQWRLDVAAKTAVPLPFALLCDHLPVPTTVFHDLSRGNAAGSGNGNDFIKVQ